MKVSKTIKRRALGAAGEQENACVPITALSSGCKGRGAEAGIASTH